MAPPGDHFRNFSEQKPEYKCFQGIFFAKVTTGTHKF